MWRYKPIRAEAASFLRFRDHTQIHPTRQDSSAGGIVQSQRPVPHNRQQPQETDTNIFLIISPNLHALLILLLGIQCVGD
jgi:hypothetical protein